MTEQTTQVPEVNAAEIEQFFIAKQQHVKQLNDSYNEFMMAIEGIPAMKSLLTVSMQHFYTGLIVMEKAIAHVPFKVTVSASPESKPEEQEVNETDAA